MKEHSSFLQSGTHSMEEGLCSFFGFGFFFLIFYSFIVMDSREQIKYLCTIGNLT